MYRLEQEIITESDCRYALVQMFTVIKVPLGTANNYRERL